MNQLQQSQQYREILIFKTDIGTLKKVRAVKPLLKNNCAILKWTVDISDIDHVLRIESNGDINEQDIIRMVIDCGFRCEALPD